ncbi:hypothetical protein NSK_002020 [Nannochloropsis salina CCMP1776]|uniref:Endonuclease/exonuclease/phosphatase domain-containing protein n=1 Tax=Nannochloropsis salina CCMP1776 TaxID=1027361 RepID=A0A4D9D5U0_9STRA|nr:hypothetical protein NSK_002020 [Nannochloropsis salina CCMP1776]|eukprot:TFJ86932.1 hypothetical protein NSK_002020 [Nannochloropsis salina CCMP1776]
MSTQLNDNRETETDTVPTIRNCWNKLYGGTGGAFDWRLGPMGFLCETLWGGGASFGPLSWFFYVEGLLFPVSQTCHQKRIIEALLPSLPHHLPSAPIPFGRGHNQGLLVLSKHPLHRPLRRYLTCTPVHHMGFQAFTVAPLPREGGGDGGEAGAREDIRFVNLHLVPNFQSHPWKGRVLGWLGERDVPRMQAKQLAEIGEEVGREGGKEGGTGGRLWCVVGDFNVHGPRVLGVGSLVDQVTCPQEQHILDHFVSPLPYKYQVFADNTLSDHYPVLATFAL